MDAKVAAGWQIKNPPVFVPSKGGALPVILEELWRPFREHAKVVGAGEPISGIESAGAGSRVRYASGAIYLRPDGGTAWVYGAIGQRYDELCQLARGCPCSWSTSAIATAITSRTTPTGRQKLSQRYGRLRRT